MKLFSVNNVLHEKEALYGKEIFLDGVLSLQENDVLIDHWPKSERSKSIYQKIWVKSGEGAYNYNLPVLKRLSDKRVVVYGKLSPSPDNLWYGDPGCNWSVHIVAKELTEHKLWFVEHGKSEI